MSVWKRLTAWWSRWGTDSDSLDREVARLATPEEVYVREEVFIQAGLYDQWYPVSEDIEVRVNSSDLIGNFWVRKRK